MFCFSCSKLAQLNTNKSCISCQGAVYINIAVLCENCSLTNNKCASCVKTINSGQKTARKCNCGRK